MYHYIIVDETDFDLRNAQIAQAFGCQLWVNSIEDLPSIDGVVYMHVPQQAWHLFPDALPALPQFAVQDVTQEPPLRWLARLFEAQEPVVQPISAPLPQLVADEERIPGSSFGELVALGEGRFGVGGSLTESIIAKLQAPRTMSNPIGGLLHPQRQFAIEHDGAKVTRVRLAKLVEASDVRVVYWPHRWASENPEIDCRLLWWWFVLCEDRSLQGLEEPWSLDLSAV